MQMSTRKADYLVDVIALRSLVGPVLAPMFANVKVSPLSKQTEYIKCSLRLCPHIAAPSCSLQWICKVYAESRVHC